MRPTSLRRIAMSAALLGAGTLALACNDASKSERSAAFASFVDSYFDSLYAYAPSQGTAAGFHQYDSKIEDLSAASVRRRVATLKAELAHLDTLRVGKMAADDSRMVNGRGGRPPIQNLVAKSAWSKSLNSSSLGSWSQPSP